MTHAMALAWEGTAVRHLADHMLRAERLGPDFPLAPNGAMLVLEKATDVPPTMEAAVTARLFASFTQREKDVLRLALEGRNSLKISAALGIGAGSIRNVKTRLYRKSGVFSEGELVLKFLPFVSLL